MRDLLASLEIGPRLLDEDTQGIVDEADVNALSSAVFLEENRKDREESLEEAAVQSSIIWKQIPVAPAPSRNTPRLM